MEEELQEKESTQQAELIDDKEKYGAISMSTIPRLHTKNDGSNMNSQEID